MKTAELERPLIAIFLMGLVKEENPVNCARNSCNYVIVIFSGQLILVGEAITELDLQFFEVHELQWRD